MTMYDIKRERKYWDMVAMQYNERILSPFMDGVINPLYEYVEGLQSDLRDRVVDLGCGTGTLLPFLADQFEEVWAVDLSRNMIMLAKESVRQCKREKKKEDKARIFKFRQMDFRRLSKLKHTFNVVVSVNSITAPEDQIISHIIREIHKVLEPRGIFLGIFPSFDTVLYQRDLTVGELMEKGMRKDDAIKKANEYFVGRNLLNIENRTYADDGFHIQRVFSPDDVRSFVEKGRLSVIKLQKVLYPWDLCRKYGFGYFPGKPEIWDWFVAAAKESGGDQIGR